MSPDEFKTLLRERSAADIVADYITTELPGPVVSQDALDFVAAQVRVRFALNGDQSIKPIVVGSAKLGFSFTEKVRPEYKPRYREYVAGVSDIDLAIVSPRLYGALWSSIARYGASQASFPWRTDDLGDYMLHGWIRPDKFPIPAPAWANDWFDFMRALNGSEHFRFKKLRCALYHSKFFLDLYQQRGVKAAQDASKIEDL